MTDAQTELDIADFIAERARRNPKVQHAIHEVQMFDGLTDQPGWKRLYDKITNDKDTFLSSLAKRLIRGGKTTAEEIAFMRGFYSGATWVVSYPLEAEKSLETAARIAWLLAQEEVQKLSEEDSLNA